MTSIYRFTERVPVIGHVKRDFGVELVRGFQKKSVTRKILRSENKEELLTERKSERGGGGRERGEGKKGHAV